jgi:ribosomal protein L11 methyltransferase
MNNIKEFYYELEVKPSSHYEHFLDLLIDIYPEGFEELNGSFILRNEDSLDDIEWTLNLFRDKWAEATGEEIELSIQKEKKQNIDWIENFKKSIQPILIEPFYIHPSWHSPKSGFQNIILDPALAFGSGHHETTSSCVEILRDEATSSTTLLDVGTGSGILSLIASKIGSTVDLCDIDPISVESAIENFSKNGLSYRDAWEGSAHSTEREYNLVVANIIPDVIVAIAYHLRNRVKDGGKLLLSGILQNSEERVLEQFTEFSLVKRIQKNEWVTLLLEKK